MRIKIYTATWNNCSEIFAARTIREAKKYAQFYKRRNGIKGITIVKSSK